MSKKKRRIKYINGWGYGNYQIQEKRWFLFIPYWKGTHLYKTEHEARGGLEYLNKLPDYGDVLK